MPFKNEVTLSSKGPINPSGLRGAKPMAPDSCLHCPSLSALCGAASKIPSTDATASRRRPSAARGKGDLVNAASNDASVHKAAPRQSACPGHHRGAMSTASGNPTSGSRLQRLLRIRALPRAAPERAARTRTALWHPRTIGPIVPSIHSPTPIHNPLVCIPTSHSEGGRQTSGSFQGKVICNFSFKRGP